MINGPLLNKKITSIEGRLHELIASGPATSRIVEEFYLSGLGRFPRQDEQEFWQQQLGSGDPPLDKLEDFVWSLLNCRDFVTNH